MKSIHRRRETQNQKEDKEKDIANERKPDSFGFWAS